MSEWLCLVFMVRSKKRAALWHDINIQTFLSAILEIPEIHLTHCNHHLWTSTLLTKSIKLNLGHDPKNVILDSFEGTAFGYYLNEL